MKQFLLLLLWGWAGAAGAATNEFFPLWQPASPNIVDLALIYQGGAQRPLWTSNRYAAYVTYKNSQTEAEQWLFDGFLFIEFADGRHHSFEATGRGGAAQKEHWQALLDKNFGADGVPALEEVCRAATKRIGPPARRRQVILTLPTPNRGQTNWGDLDGRALDFNHEDDRVAACHWFMDAALAKWHALAPADLDFAGFYWVSEGAAGERKLLLSVAADIHQRGLKFFWIPYWQPGRAAAVGDWRACGFDEAWQQPNHFFHPEVPDSRLQQACDFARQHGLGLEMEFDARLMTESRLFEPRLDAYLAAFTRNGVKTNSSLAWYEGGGALYQLAQSTNAAMRRHYDKVANFILTRQRLADDKSKEAAPK